MTRRYYCTGKITTDWLKITPPHPIAQHHNVLQFNLCDGKDPELKWWLQKRNQINIISPTSAMTSWLCQQPPTGSPDIGCPWKEEVLFKGDLTLLVTQNLQSACAGCAVHRCDAVTVCSSAVELKGEQSQLLTSHASEETRACHWLDGGQEYDLAFQIRIKKKLVSASLS